MKRLLTGSLIAAVAAAAHAAAPNYSDFTNSTFTDVFVSQSGNQFTVTLGADPTVNGNAIYDIFGFFNLSPSQSGLGALPTGTDQNNWTFEAQNDGGSKGEVAGWDASQGSDKFTFGLYSGQSLTFTYSSLSTSSNPEYGFDICLNSGNPDMPRGATGNYRGDALPPGTNNSTPAPAALASFGIGAFGLLRRRMLKA